MKGSKPLDLASVLKKKIQPGFKKIEITGVGWHTFRHTVETNVGRDVANTSWSAVTCVTATCT
ncbi:MAG: hypothetical protein WA252_20705 [Candidatus Sulfotelmatobacter sp.]